MRKFVEQVLLRFQAPVAFLLFVLVFASCSSTTGGGQAADERVRGWNILSGREKNAYAVIDAAGEHRIMVMAR